MGRIPGVGRPAIRIRSRRASESDGRSLSARTSLLPRCTHPVLSCPVQSCLFSISTSTSSSQSRLSTTTAIDSASICIVVAACTSLCSPAVVHRSTCHPQTSTSAASAVPVAVPDPVASAFWIAHLLPQRISISRHLCAARSSNTVPHYNNTSSLQ